MIRVLENFQRLKEFQSATFEMPDSPTCVASFEDNVDTYHDELDGGCLEIFWIYLTGLLISGP